MRLPLEVVEFFEHQTVVIIATLDGDNYIHCSVKGIAGVESEGRVWVVDLYVRETFANIKRSPCVSITAVDEKKFIGYTLQGKAKVIHREAIPRELLESWEKRIVQRMSSRVIQGVQAEKKSKGHFEASLPFQPQYILEISVEKIIDLSPPAMRKGQ